MSVGAVNKNTGDRIPTAGNPLDKVGNLASLHTTAKDDAVSAINEVTDEMQDKTDNDAVAPEFNNTTAYSTGELVYKDGQLYKFDSDHAAGAWDASEVSPTTVAAEFNKLKNTINNISARLDENTISSGNVVTLAYDTEYITLSDGYFRISCTGSADTWADGLVNGISVLRCTSVQTQTASGIASIFVRKGSKIKFNGKNNTDTGGRFYPLT